MNKIENDVTDSPNKTTSCFNGFFRSDPQKTKDKEINRRLKKWHKQEKEVVKLLLLGE